MKVAVHWFRRDLRVSDNTALLEAARRAEQIVPLFILEDAFRTGPDVGAARTTYLLRAVECLRRSLKELGYTLIVRCGKSEEELLRVCREAKAQAVFCNRRYEPYALARDGRIRQSLQREGIAFEQFKDAVIWEEREILTQQGGPYTVFTPYARAWKARKIPAPIPSLSRAKHASPDLRSDRLPTSDELGHKLEQSVPEAGEEAARRRLQKFMSESVLGYDRLRDVPAVDGTSQLSFHLRAGTVGIRTVLECLQGVSAKAVKSKSAKKDGQPGCETFLNELIWREFYLQILANFPHVMKGCFRPEYDALEWSANKKHFQAWCEGMTGYPIVDAAMRCLNDTGWMHNRLRMIVAMFLTKDLLINWQWGERYFMKKLVDGDMAANNGGWQWSAGTGTDAAPYFRIFNPVSQGERFDPEGSFVRAWVPELADLPGKSIHQPWEAGELFVSRKYPARIVRHEEQRPRCLEMYKKIKK